MNFRKIFMLLMALLGTLLLSVIAFVIIVNIKEVNDERVNSFIDIDLVQDYLNSEQEIESGSTIASPKEEASYEEMVEQLERDNQSALEQPSEAGDLNQIPNNTFIPLSQLEQFYELKRTKNVRGHPVLTVYDREVTFNLNTKYIFYDEDKIYNEPFIYEHDEVLIPASFITDYYNLYIHETKSGLKLTAFRTIPILLYHTVNEGNNNTINTQPEHFEDHIRTLALEGYTAISPQQLYDFYFGLEELPEKPIFINFDDGYKDNFTNAYPILQKYNMQATIFIIASRIEDEGKNSYPFEFPKISWEDAYAMKDLITIQSHTWDSHRKIRNKQGAFIGQIAAPQQKANDIWETNEEYISRITNDIYKSQNIIKQKMGYDSIIFSFPYGEYSQEAISVASQLGVKFGLTVSQGKELHIDSLMTIKRLTVDGNLTGEQLLDSITK